MSFLPARSRTPIIHDVGGSPFLVAVSGGSASGKTSFCKLLKDKFPGSNVVLIAQDRFYKPLSEEEKSDIANKNFDHPDSIDFEMIRNVLTALKDGSRIVDIPTYDFVTSSRRPETETIWRPDVILFEGILAYHNTPTTTLRDLFDLRIFVETESDVRLGRRILRDTSERGRTLQSIFVQYDRFVRPAYQEFVLPQKKYADLIIPWGDYSANSIADDQSWKIKSFPALELIVQSITNRIQSINMLRGVTPTHENCSSASPTSVFSHEKA